MKHLLATTTILALSAGFASAEVTLSGDARMGIIGGDGVDTSFTSRARVKFSMSGETDGGLAFGASFRADNAGDASSGDAGEVYISGAFGKLSMGDVDGAAAAAVGQVSGVGLTGLGDLNEIAYISSGGSDWAPFGATDDPSALYEYSTGSFTGYISVTNPSGSADAMAIGAKYSFGDFTVSAGYEQLDHPVTFSETNLVLGASATFGAVTAKVIWSEIDYSGGINQASDSQLALSVDYSADALTVTAFYTDSEEAAPSIFGGEEAYGIGASYDLGGGASVVGGYAVNQTADSSAFDLGLSFSF